MTDTGPQGVARKREYCCMQLMIRVSKATTYRCSNTTTGMAQEPTVAVPYGCREWRRANLDWAQGCWKGARCDFCCGFNSSPILFERKPRRSSLDLPPLCRLKHDDPFHCGELRLSSLLKLAEELANQVAELSCHKESGCQTAC